MNSNRLSQVPRNRAILAMFSRPAIAMVNLADPVKISMNKKSFLGEPLKEASDTFCDASSRTAKQQTIIINKKRKISALILSDFFSLRFLLV